MIRPLTPLVLFAVAWTSPPSIASAQGGLQPPPAPPGNPVTTSKTLLGKTLFWDEQLSSGGTMSCGSCHFPQAGGSDPRSIPGDPRSTHPGADGLFGTPDDVIGSPGVVQSTASGAYLASDSFSLAPQVTGRRAMPAINGGYSPRMFWDGRAEEMLRDPVTGQVVLNRFAALESQVLGPPVSSVEMGHIGREWPEVAAKIAVSEPLALAESLTPDLNTWLAGRSYPDLFSEAFGDPAVTPVRIAMAIATYERTLFTGEAPIDDFLAGDPNALTQQEQRGFNLFNDPRLGCTICHGGPLFSDQAFHYTGVTPQNEDPGLGAIDGDPGHIGQMKTPSLRNVALRAPYFHNGSAPSLQAVVGFYDRGGNFNGPNKAPGVRPLNLSPQERADLVAFLGRPLTDPRVRDGLPPFDRPILYSESGRVPQPYGRPTAGSGAISPVMVAVEPAQLGNDTLTVGVDRALGGARAWLAIDPVADPIGSLVFGAECFLGLSADLRLLSTTLADIGAGQGTGSVTMAIPDRPSLLGRNFHGQWFVEDPGAAAGLAASAAVTWTLF